MIAGLHVEEHGRPGGPPLILSPGLGGSALYWQPHLEALSGRYRVILYDHRGTGRSDRGLPPNLGIDDFANDILAIMDGLGLDRATLIGHAAGGVAGLALALRAPERLERLVVVNGFAAADPHFVRCMETRLALLRCSGVAAFVRAQPIFLYPSRWISANRERVEREESLQIENFQGVEAIEARIAALGAVDIDARLGEIYTPTLLIAAEDDMLVPPSSSERLAARLPNATLVRLDGGHACNVTHPRDFDRILLGWLDAALTEGVF